MVGTEGDTGGDTGEVSADTAPIEGGAAGELKLLLYMGCLLISFFQFRGRGRGF